MEARGPETLPSAQSDAAPDIEMPLREARVGQEAVAEVPPEALSGPNSELGAELLDRVATTARAPLSFDEPPATVQTASLPEEPLAELPLVTDRAWTGVQRPRSAPALYTRGPDVYVGPDPSATVLNLSSLHQERVSRHPESPASALGIAATQGPRPADESPLARLQAIFGGGEAVQQETVAQEVTQYLRGVSGETQQEEMVLSSTSQFPEVASEEPLEASAQRMQELEDEDPLPLVEPSTSQPSEEESDQQESVSSPSDVSASDAGVQRAESDEDDDSEEDAAAEPDLEKLARDIYPIVKRMLAIERERMPGLGR